MKTNNTKIKIKKDRIIKEENYLNENEYDFTQQFQGMGQALVDSAKMTYQTLKRMFNSIVFGIKSLNALRKGDLKKMKTLSSEFSKQDERLKQEQNKLIDAQPGVKDLNLFLTMTSPGSVMFDKFLNVDKPEVVKKVVDFFKGSDQQKNIDKNSEAAYHNLMMRLGEIVFNAKITLNNSRDLSDDILHKTPKDILSKKGDENFKKAIAFLGNFYSKSVIEESLYFSMGKYTYEVLYSIHEGQKGATIFGKGIIDIIKKNNLSHEIESIVSRLGAASTKSKFKAKLKKFDYTGSMMKPEEAQSSKQQIEDERAEEAETQASEKNESYNRKTILLKRDSIIIVKNNLNVLEEGLFDFWKGTSPGKSIKDIEDMLKKEKTEVDLKESMEASFSLHFIIKAYIYTSVIHIICKRLAFLAEFKVQNLKEINSFEKISDNSVDTLKKVLEECQKDSLEIDNSIDVFNKQYKEKLSKVSEKTLKTTVDEFIKGASDHNKKFQEASKDKSEIENKKICYSIILSMLEDKEFQEMTKSSIISDFEKEVSKYNKSFDFYIKSINEKAIQNNKDKFDKLSTEFQVPADVKDKIDTKRSEINSFLEMLKKSHKTFNNFLGEADTIQQDLKKLESEEEKVETSSETGGNTIKDNIENLEKKDSKFASGYIIPPEIANKLDLK